MDKIDFKFGKIVYNEFHVDFYKPFSEQLDCLTEDLLQVKYPGEYLLDLGWYPEYELDGQFTVQLIKEGNWDYPKYKKSCREQKELKRFINEGIYLATRNMDNI